jgi:hypothetical protein
MRATLSQASSTQQASKYNFFAGQSEATTQFFSYCAAKFGIFLTERCKVKNMDDFDSTRSWPGQL